MDVKKTDSLKTSGAEKSDDKEEGEAAEESENLDASASNAETVPNKLVRELSLIDSEVPDNLGTPLQPTSPLDAEFGEQAVILEPEKASGGEESAAGVETEASDVELLAQKEKTKESSDSASSEEDNKSGDENKKEKEGVVDMYSETAMEELEALGDDDLLPSSPRIPGGAAAAEECATSSNQNEAVGAAEIPVSGSGSEKGKTEEAQESADTFEEVPRRRNGGLSDEKAMRRKSWHEKSDRRSLTADDTPTKQEVKLRKSASMDVSRASLKKLRSTESKPGKTAPSPVKATYRPVSMPVEMVEAMEENGDPERVAEDNDSDNDDSMSICSFGSRADLHRLGEAPVPSWIQPGEPVIVLSSQGSSKNGTVTFIGQTEFAGGNWVGVELDTPDGKNDGSVKGVRYFKCRQRHGIFVRHDKLIMDKKRKGKKMKNVPSSLRKSTGNLNSPSPQKDTLPSPSSSKSFMKGTTASASKKK
jgi:kinesin family protein 13